MSRRDKEPNLERIHQKLQTSLEFFCQKAPLIIKDKSGNHIPFRFNFVQRKIHEALERQLQDKGWVRALIVKPRQPGCSTYVQARFYHKTTRNKGTNTFILTHLADASENIYNMVERFQDHCTEAVKPEAEISNRRRMGFTKIDSQYTVGTAGSKAVGRSATTKLFHGSEVAFWENTDEIETGVMQTVAMRSGTEMILESTANGMGNMFYRKAMQARRGEGDYILIFIAWFEHEEYLREVDKNFETTEAEKELAKVYNLTDEQLSWRRAKINELESEWKFKQEYPSNVDEAFQTSGESLIPVESIVRARHSKYEDKTAPMVMGVDPASVGDRAVIAFRRGRVVPKIYVFHTGKQPITPMEFVGKLSKLILKHKPSKCFVDVGEGGRAICDRLFELGFDDTVVPVNFGSRPDDEEQYLNKRAEMWLLMRDWFKEPETSIEDRDDIQADMMAMPQYKLTSSARIQLVSKDKIREDFGQSTDIGDALALTFAYPIERGLESRIEKVNIEKSGISTLQKRRLRDGGSNTDNSFGGGNWQRR